MDDHGEGDGQAARYIEDLRAGDVIAAADSFVQDTNVVLSEPIMWGMIGIGYLIALAGLAKSMRAMVQPLVQTLASNMRDDHVADIDAMKRRLEELERQQPGPPPP